MPLLRDEDAAKLREIFDERLIGDVTLVHYTQWESRLIVPGAAQCPSCKDAQALLEEVSATSERIELEVHDFAAELDEAQAAGIDKIPATLIKGEMSDGRVRFFGLPSGYEFASLIEDIIDVGSGSNDLPLDTLEALRGLQKDVHIQVFVTPTCPYCPAAVRTAHKFAMASEHVRADMVAAGEFPQLSQRYQVMAVPKTVINETASFEGAVPEDTFLQRVLEAAGS